MIPTEKKAVSIEVDEISLDGNLVIPTSAAGLVIFSHGSGSGRFSPRNNYVAGVLNKNGFGTLLFDLLTETEDKVYKNRFDLDKLTKRLIAVTNWTKHNPESQGLNLGFFGASTGSASALKATAYLGNEINAVVSRGGRPDLALKELPEVTAPTLLIVGGLDDQVIQLNQMAYEKLLSERNLVIVPGASHLFEEPGKLEEVARISSDWFTKWL